MDKQIENEMLDMLVSQAADKDIKEFNKGSFLNDTAILAVMDTVDDNELPAHIRKQIPPILMMVALMMKTTKVDPEDLICRICAKHLALRSIRAGDEDLHRAYTEIEYALDVIKKELNKK